VSTQVVSRVAELEKLVWVNMFLVSKNLVSFN